MSVSGWGLWCRFVGGVDKVGSVFEPVGGAVDRDDVAVVQEAVQDGGGQDVVAEDGAPFGEGLVAGDDGGALLVAA